MFRDLVTYFSHLALTAAQECNLRLLKFVMSWQLYGSTIFEVLVCVCVCVCVRERETERQRDRETETERA
jgi:hypothetical protein